MDGIRQAEPDPPESLFYAEMVGQAVAQVVPEDQAAARLAARDRFAVPEVHPGNPQRDSRRQTGLQNSAEGKSRRDQGQGDRARRQDPHGEGLPGSRPLRRRDGHRHGFLQAPGRGFPGPRHPGPQRRKAAQSRFEHHQARARIGADGRSDQPLQHDVRSLLHGRQPGRVRARAELGRYPDSARQRHLHQAATADVGAVFGRRADAFAVLSGCRPLLAQGRLQQRAGGHQRHRIRQEFRVCQESRRSRVALRLPAVRRHRQRRQLASQGRAICSM